MQKTINFNLPALNLDGAPLTDGNKDITLGSILAGVIARQTTGDALKLLGWAMAINKNEDIFLDKSDLDTLKNLINNNTEMTILIKGQLLEVLIKD